MSRTWRAEGACTDPRLAPDTFYPEEDDHVALANATEICSRCPVANWCLEDALTTDERYGIRAGLLPEERQGLINGAPEISPVRRRAQLLISARQIVADGGTAGDLMDRHQLGRRQVEKYITQARREMKEPAA